MKILFLVNDLNFFITHRFPIANYMQFSGYNVYIGYGDLGGADTKFYINKGFKLIHVPMYRGSISPIKNIITFYNIWKLFSNIRPDIAHLITIKPYLFGGIIARYFNVPSLVSTVAGLGIIFKKNLFAWILRKFLYYFFKISFSHKNQFIIFQNTQDAKLLTRWGVLNKKRIKIIKGSGVEINKFKNLDDIKGIPVVTFASRLLFDKGVLDFIKAAEIIKSRGINAKFVLAGKVDPYNKYSLKKKDIIEIQKKKIVEVLGHQTDIPNLFWKSHIICLPSYYGEGLPKVLIEAAAAQRAVITTNHPGCRDAIIPNKTGILVPIKNPTKLANAIQYLIENYKVRISMGLAGRDLAEREFNIEKIVNKHAKIYTELNQNLNL